MERLVGESGLDAAATRLGAGGVLVFPTETFYGLAADPRNPEAVAALLRAKGRPEGQALPLLAGDRSQVQLVAPGWETVPLAEKLAEAFWPGPLSLILPAAPELAPGVAGADGSVAVRVSSHPLAAALARRFGHPLIATSANKSGEAPATEASDAARGLAGSPGLAVLDGGPTAGGAPSTLVDPRTSPPRILREGAVPPSALAVVLGGEGQ